MSPYLSHFPAAQERPASRLRRRRTAGGDPGRNEPDEVHPEQHHPSLFNGYHQVITDQDQAFHSKNAAGATSKPTGRALVFDPVAHLLQRHDLAVGVLLLATDSGVANVSDCT